VHSECGPRVDMGAALALAEAWSVEPEAAGVLLAEIAAGIGEAQIKIPTPTEAPHAHTSPEYPTRP